MARKRSRPLLGKKWWIWFGFTALIEIYLVVWDLVTHTGHPYIPGAAAMIIVIVGYVFTKGKKKNGEDNP